MIKRNDIQINSKDLQKVIRLHKSFPKLHLKVIPSAIRREIKPLQQEIRNNTKKQNWSRKFSFRKGAKVQDLTQTKTRTTKRPKEAGIILSARHSGPSSLMEHGSNSRKTTRGASRGFMPARPAYEPAFQKFKGTGKTSIQQEVIKETILHMDRAIRKHGLK